MWQRKVINSGWIAVDVLTLDFQKLDANFIVFIRADLVLEATCLLTDDQLGWAVPDNCGVEWHP